MMLFACLYNDQTGLNGNNVFEFYGCGDFPWFNCALYLIIGDHGDNGANGKRVVYA